MTDDLNYLSASELADLIRSRRLSPVELMRRTLARIERAQPVLNAFITVCSEQALAEAHDAEAALTRGEWRGPLHGIPFSVKDLVNTKGVRTTYGSRIFEHHVPSVDHVRSRVSRPPARSSSARPLPPSSVRRVSRTLLP